MKDLIKTTGAAIIALGGMARMCTKSVSSTMKIAEPIANVRITGKSTKIEESVYRTSRIISNEDEIIRLHNKKKSDFPVVESFKTAKDVAEVTDKITNVNIIDTVKIIVKRNR